MEIAETFFYPFMIASGMIFVVRLLSRIIIIPDQLLFLFLGGALATAGVFSHTDPLIQWASVVAIMLLLFQTGLEEHCVRQFFRTVIKNLRVAIVSAIGPWMGAFIAVRFGLGLTFTEAVIAGAAFTATALPFTLGMLRSNNLLETPGAKSAIAASTTDDILASLLGAFTAIFLSTSSAGGAEGVMMAGGKAGMVLLFFVLIYVISHIIDPHPSKKALIDLHKFTQYFYTKKIMTPFILFVLAALVYVGEVFFHVHYAIGALMVGLLFKHDLFYCGKGHQEIPNKEAPTFKNFETSIFVVSRTVEPFFYIFLGLHLDFSVLSLATLWTGGLIFALVATLQFLAAYNSGRWIGLSKQNGILLGISMLPRDVLAFVVLSMNAAHLPENSILFPSAIVAIVLLNILTTIGVYWYKTEYGEEVTKHISN